ncbi:MAG: hypothetical protein KJO46_06500, partial [Gammaproteobacteria bacterium]|nr:hypothetical protein [Gammaproteobacteria bacterium]
VVNKAESTAQTVSGAKRFDKRWNWTIMTGSMEVINVAGVGGHIDGMAVNHFRAASIAAGNDITGCRPTISWPCSTRL